MSYLRTPGVGKYYEEGEWVEFIRKVIREGANFDYSPYVHHILLSYRFPILCKGTITLVESSPAAEPFLINDCGVTFIDSKNAIYPYSKHNAVWISLDGAGARNLSDDDVIRINVLMMSQIYEILGLILDSNVGSIQAYKSKNPDDERYGALYYRADKISASANSEYTLALRRNSGVDNVIVPSEYFHFLDESISDAEIIALEDGGDFRSLAAIEIFQRYDLLNHSFDIMGIISRSIGYDYLICLVKWYKDKSENEFDKMCSVVFLEIASDKGFSEASDRLYRYHTKGKHLRKDPDKARFYFERACEQRNPDSLKDFFRSMQDDPDYESKTSRYLDKVPKEGSLYLMISQMYRCHGDKEKCLFWLEKAAKTAYTGAVSIWVKYWSNREPLEIDKIEMLNDFVLKKQLGAAHILADFYDTHRDICPGKFEWFIGELRKKENVFAHEILRKYGLE